MKKTGILLLTVFVLTRVFGQIDKHGNPIFNSRVISEEKFDKFDLTSSYYTIRENITNRQSSVYVSDHPSLDAYLKFSRDLPAASFIVCKGQRVLCMIMLLQKNEGEKTTLFYNIINPSTKKSFQVPCSVWGEINEKRAEELLQLKIDSASAFIDLPNNGKGLLFNGIAYRIQPYEQLKEEVIAIVNQLLANGNKAEKNEDQELYIRKESIGGTLDFSKVLLSEKQTMFLHDGIAYNKKEFAIYLWGRKVKQLGIHSAEGATRLWESIHTRELTIPEKKALENGFESKDQSK